MFDDNDLCVGKYIQYCFSLIMNYLRWIFRLKIKVNEIVGDDSLGNEINDNIFCN